MDRGTEERLFSEMWMMFRGRWGLALEEGSAICAEAVASEVSNPGLPSTPLSLDLERKIFDEK